MVFGSQFERLCVVFVDLVGFSTLMSDDEFGAYQKWSRLRDEVLMPGLEEFSGQYIKSTGDGLLATFEETKDAARWACQMQSSARSLRLGLTLRIALNCCNVIRDKADLHGDGLNIASRLQERAVPGGVIVSATAYNDLKDEIDLELRDLGELSLKNIPNPVRAYDLVTDGRPIGLQRKQESGVPSIAIMPFKNLGSADSDDYIAEGIAEDIIVSLSGLKELIVISRGSTMALNPQIIDPGDIGRVLGVSYLLSGTMRRLGNRIKISYELVDTKTAHHLFADRDEFDEHQLFEFQDQMVQSIVGRIAPNIQQAEIIRVQREHPENFSAYDCYLRALNLMSSLNRNEFELAREYLEEAMTLDPTFATPVAWAARWRAIKLGQGWSTDYNRDAKMAAELASKAIELDAENSLALCTFGHVRSFVFSDYLGALDYHERSVKACPNHATAWMLYSGTMSHLKNGCKAIEFAERALRLSPFDRNLSYFYTFLGFANYAAGQFRDAIRWCRRAELDNPHYTSNLRILSASLAAEKRLESAREVGKRLMQLDPDFRVYPYVNSGKPFAKESDRMLVAKHWLAAGIPK